LLNGYGTLLPWLIPLGLVGGLLAERSRLTSMLMAGYYVCHAASVLLVLPEAKHLIPLLLPAHVLGALGLWSAARALGSLRRARFLIPAVAPRLLVLAGASLALLLVWGLLGALAYRVSERQRSRIVDSVNGAAATARSEPALLDKQFTIHAEPGSSEPVGYLLKVRASRPSSLLCLHVRGSTEHDGFLAYYTRHPIEPGADRFFFFNVVSGVELGDARPYTAHVRLVGPARLIAIRRLDLSRWPFGLPMSLVFDADDGGTARTMMGTTGAAFEKLPAPSDVGRLLQDPGAFLSSYRRLELNGLPAP